MKKSFNDFACFVCLILTAALMLLSGLFSGQVLSILTMIQTIALLVGVSFGALAYTKKSTIKAVLFWISIIVIALSAFGIL